MRYGTLFSGGGIFEQGIGDKARHVFAVENDSEIASYWSKNWKEKYPGLLYSFDILEVDEDNMPYVDYIHASPPCQNFSIARSFKDGETEKDILYAHKIIQILKANKAFYFTLENVPKYKDSISFKIILEGLVSLGYFLEGKVLNLSHYGVPQTRRRFILVASKACRKTGRKALTNSLIPREDNCITTWKDIFNGLELPEVEPTPKEVIKQKENESKSIICDRYQVTTRTDLQPCFTIKASIGTDGKGCNRNKFIDYYNVLTDKWYTLTPRAVARLQTIPDSYILPKETQLALKIIGNGVPCEFSKRLFNHLLYWG